jgi:large subunit ribosomal protein L10e
MAKLRKSSAYSKKYARPYTRTSKKRTKSYIKTKPPIKLVKFNMGNQKAYNTNKFDTLITMVSEERIQARDNALEAVRQAITRKLDKTMQGQFYFEVKVYPHHILRENKMLTGAGADRMQSGMKHSFGKTAGRAAMIPKGKEIYLIAISGEKNSKIVREVLKSVKSKLPCKTKVITEKIKK